MDRSVIIALVIFVFLWIVILKYCIETNDWTGFIYLNGLALLVTTSCIWTDKNNKEDCAIHSIIRSIRTVQTWIDEVQV